eukprot:m.9783 g.9783  ORF g.9783 m.9783 type:complete len:278 (+) comp4132_c0_seq1:230-1063(+)
MRIPCTIVPTEEEMEFATLNDDFMDNKQKSNRNADGSSSTYHPRQLENLVGSRRENKIIGSANLDLSNRNSSQGKRPRLDSADDDSNFAAAPTQRKHVCNKCGKSFSNRGHLSQHERVHTGDRPYKCDMCEKAFAQCGDLRRHKRVHTGEKPFQCSVCLKRFTQCGNLKKHMKVHSQQQQEEHYHQPPPMHYPPYFAYSAYPMPMALPPGAPPPMMQHEPPEAESRRFIGMLQHKIAVLEQTNQQLRASLKEAHEHVEILSRNQRSPPLQLGTTILK